MSILFTILAGILGVSALFVLLSCAIAWYEYANRDPELLQHRFQRGGLWLALRLAATETLAVFCTALLHPFGWIPAGTSGGGNGTPVILLHGLFHNRICWLWTRHRLKANGFRNIHTLNLPPWKDVETLTERLAKRVDELRQNHGVEKVHLVGHSMGGMIARNYFQIRGGAAKVEKCVLLGAPNHGSKLAPFALTPLGLLLVPGSAFLRRLAEAPLPEGVQVHSIFSRHDNLVIPFESARLPGAVNLELQGVGHDALLYHPAATKAVITCLKEEPV